MDAMRRRLRARASDDHPNEPAGPTFMLLGIY
jgi:hypothetical protein